MCVCTNDSLKNRTASMDGAGLGPYYPTWKKTRCLFHEVSRMPVKEKRQIFALMRSHPECTPDTLLVHKGMTLGEFCAYLLLADHTRR